ncbi:hypothetical protein [Microbulbifer agarilyticus]
MGFQVRYNTATRVVNIGFFDRVDGAEKHAAVRQVAEKYGHLHPLLVLADVRRADIQMTLEERRALGSYIAHLPGISEGRFAVLHAPEYNANVVIDSAARKEGLALMEFVTEQAAEHWLIEDEH